LDLALVAATCGVAVDAVLEMTGIRRNVRRRYPFERRYKHSAIRRRVRDGDTYNG
jgi:hypothetical protein